MINHKRLKWIWTGFAGKVATVLRVARRSLRRVWTWLAGIIIGAIAAFIGAYLTGLFDEVLPTPGELACRVREQFREPAPGSRFAILISDLAYDPEGRQTGHIAAALRGQPGIEVLRTCRVLQIDPYGLQSEAEAETLDQGREWLEERNADVLIWGEVVEANRTLRLWFLRQEGKLPQPRPYGLERTELPIDFHQELSTQLVAVALVSLAPIRGLMEADIVPLLKPVAEKLKHLMAHPPTGLSADHSAGLHNTFALAATVIGEFTGDKAWLEDAIVAYQAALKTWTRERKPVAWAMIHNNLGNAWRLLGERENDPARLEAAGRAYLQALQVFTLEQAPLQWASIQNNLGNIFMRFGHLEGAIEAYREALKAWTRDQVPLFWAGAQSNLGIALWRLGRREENMAHLKEAVNVFREALKEWTRDQVPLEWARTQVNLAKALQVLGERERDTARLKEAVAAYREALKEWTRDQVPSAWAGIQNNLGNILTTLGEQQRDAPYLEEAIEAYRQAMTVWTPEQGRFQWAGLQNNLGTTLAELGELTGDVAQIEAAAAAFRAAIEVFKTAPEHHGDLLNRAESNLQRLEKRLERRESSQGP